MIILQSTFHLLPEKVDEALDLMREMMRMCQHEHGCRHYKYFQGLGDPGEVLLLQEWTDAPSLQGHYETDHMGKFVRRLSPMLRSPITTRSYISQSEESIPGGAGEPTPESHHALH